ncbi:MAG: phage holin family protein [Mycobacteriales bacterium]|nr:phage holin family protein [Frankia sp.]
MPSTKSDRSLGELVAEATAELSTLFRKEVELAKVEIRDGLGNAGKGAGAFGAAGFAGYLALLFFSLAVVFALDAAGLALWVAFLLVASCYGVVAALLAKTGKRALANASPVPDRTVETLKEDVAWAKHPTR